MSETDTPENSGYDVSIIRPEINAADVQNRGRTQKSEGAMENRRLKIA